MVSNNEMYNGLIKIKLFNHLHLWLNIAMVDHFYEIKRSEQQFQNLNCEIIAVS